MRKVKNVLMVILTLILLAAGSLLPTAAARMQDKKTANVVQYEDIEALQLKLEEEIPSMTFYEKLHLLGYGMGTHVTDEKTRLKENDIIEIVSSALIPYMELYFGTPQDIDYIQHQAAMVYDESDPSRLNYYWHVTLSVDASATDYTTVILDDETGAILAIEMIDPYFNIDEVYVQELQYAITTIYFKQLGIEPVAEWPVEAAAVWEGDLPVVATNYQFVDAVYGEINIQVYVHSDGFSMNIV